MAAFEVHQKIGWMLQIIFVNFIFEALFLVTLTIKPILNAVFSSMKTTPVSIIVPNYNHATYLPQRLDSIFNQTFSDFEVILLDDQSTDHSVEVLQKYAGQYTDKVTYCIVNEENSGSPFVQWKKGIELAQGEFIWIAESDDFCEPTLLETLYKALLAKPTATVAAANLIQVDAKGKHLSNRTNYENAICSGEKALTKHFTSGTYLWNASAVLFRKKAVQNVDWEWVTSFKFCGDWLFWCLLLEKGALVTVRNYLSYFRVHNRSVSSLEASQYRTFTEGLDIVAWILNQFPLPLENRLATCYAWLKKLNESKIDKTAKIEFEKRIRALFPVAYPMLLNSALQLRKLKTYLLTRYKSTSLS